MKEKYNWVILLTLGVLLSISLYFNSLNGRYQCLSEYEAILDTRTGEMYYFEWSRLEDKKSINPVQNSYDRYK